MSTPLIYDISADEERPVTKFDIDRLTAISECGVLLNMIMRELVTQQPMGRERRDWDSRKTELRQILEFILSVKFTDQRNRAKEEAIQIAAQEAFNG